MGNKDNFSISLGTIHEKVDLFEAATGFIKLYEPGFSIDRS